MDWCILDARMDWCILDARNGRKIGPFTKESAEEAVERLNVYVLAPVFKDMGVKATGPFYVRRGAVT